MFLADLERGILAASSPGKVSEGRPGACASWHRDVPVIQRAGLSGN